MTASFPTSVKTFPEIVDYVDDVVAAHQNEPNDEITAIEGYLLDIAPGTIAQGRLSLTTDPEPTGDITGGTTLFYEPYVGDQIGLYLSSSSDWALMTFPELSMSLSGYSASDNVDVFIYADSDTPTMTGIKWTNDSTRAADLVRVNGAMVASTDYTRRYVGTIRMTSSTDCEDSSTRRFVWNLYHRQPVGITNAICAVDHAYTTTQWREINNGVSVTRGGLVLGQPQIVFVGGVLMSYSASGTSSGRCQVVIDAVTAGGSSVAMNAENSQGSYVTHKYGLFPILLSAGYHYITIIEYGGTANFQYYYGFNNTLTER